MILRSALIFTLLSCACFAQTDTPELVSKPNEPAYKVLFESGFYSDAVDYCTAVILGPPTDSTSEKHLYLAYSYIMLGKAELADSIFMEIFNANPDFHLSPIVTSPKIYEVYFEARTKWNNMHAADSVMQSEPDLEIKLPETSDVLQKDSTHHTESAVESIDTSRYSQAERLRPNSVLMCMPGGAGQFLNGQYVKGAAVLLIQAAAITGSVVAYYKRDKLYSPLYGWNDDNMDRAMLYTYGYKGGVIIFSTAWIYSIADGFIVRHKKHKR
jgi:hypothetical protein